MTARSLKMPIKFVVPLLIVGVLAGCTTTNTAKRETLREMNARIASTQSVPTATNEAAPPAEGPEDTDGSLDPTHNPALLPTPLLRDTAAGGL